MYNFKNEIENLLIKFIDEFKILVADEHEKAIKEIKNKVEEKIDTIIDEKFNKYANMSKYSHVSDIMPLYVFDEFLTKNMRVKLKEKHKYE